jgi:SAM-dependent methyltransferase
MTQDFVSVTELAGDEVSAEQVERICRRYYWGGEYCRGKDVLEVACGTGQGVGYLAGLAKSVIAGDASKPILAVAKRYYGERFAFHRFDAHKLPFEASSFDVVLIFEALYYLQHPNRFFSECKRVLRPKGALLIVTANKDLYDFNASPHSFRYLGVPELKSELERFGFACELFGDTPVQAVSFRQRILRPLKMIASRLGLIPKTTIGKKLLKRMVFGGLVKMPAEIREGTCPNVDPSPLDPNVPDTGHKVIFCAARLST